MSQHTSDLVAVDIGNTALKAAVFCTSDPLCPKSVFRTSSHRPDLESLGQWFPNSLTVSEVVIASVYRDGTRRLQKWLSEQRADVLWYELGTNDFPIKINVRFPARVGLDRLAAATTANRLRSPDRPAIIVDAGSAITVDFLDATGVFQGGAILPGWKTMARSLQESTDQLPMLDSLDFKSSPATIGRSTEEAIASGLFWGSVGAVRELVDRMSAVSPPIEGASKASILPHLFVSGGDMQTLAQHLSHRLECVPEMALCGIAMAASLRAAQKRAANS